jgi:ribose 5-phosphate isomerase B
MDHLLAANELVDRAALQLRGGSSTLSHSEGYVSISEAQVREMVRAVLLRTLGLTDRSTAPRSSVTISASTIDQLVPGESINIAAGDRITPLARDAARERGVQLIEHPTSAFVTAGTSVDSPIRSATNKSIAIGSDHGGFELKRALHAYLIELGYAPIDCGTFSTDSVDYPDFALAVAELVASGRAGRGIIIDGAGIGSCITANKVPSIRAAMCYDQATAVNSREHNDANVLTLGAGLIGSTLAKQIVKTFLETPFGGGRHAKRVDKIVAIERRFLK